MSGMKTKNSLTYRRKGNSLIDRYIHENDVWIFQIYARVCEKMIDKETNMEEIFLRDLLFFHQKKKHNTSRIQRLLFCFLSSKNLRMIIEIRNDREREREINRLQRKSLRKWSSDDKDLRRFLRTIQRKIIAHPSWGKTNAKKR